MGLSATQARLLTITARKSDCEFESMGLSHQKLQLARNMEDISKQYQEALNTTKLVYDYYGSNDNSMNLNYNLLMSPSVYNDYYPKLLTDSKNKVILDEGIAAAAKAAGIPSEGFNANSSSDVRNAFIKALGDANVIKPHMVDTVTNIPYNAGIGLGSDIGVSTTYEELSYDKFLDKVKNTLATDSDEYFIGIGMNYHTEFGVGDNTENYENGFPTDVVKGSTLFTVDKNNNIETIAQSQSKPYGLTLNNLLNSDINYVWTYTSCEGYSTPITDMAALQNALVQGDGFLDWLKDQLGSILGGFATNDAALQYAYDQVFNNIYPNTNIQEIVHKYEDRLLNGKTNRDDRSEFTDTDKAEVELNGEKRTCTDWMLEAGQTNGGCANWRHYTGVETGKTVTTAANYLNFSFTSEYSDFDSNRGSVSISLTNIAKSFLDYFNSYLEQDYAYYLNPKSVNDKDLDLYKEKTYTIIADSNVEGNSYLYSNFYDSLFNKICTNGWVENDKITDADYMSEMLKNGLIYISSISQDGCYYQGDYSTDNYIHEVADNSAIAMAEARYNAEKNKIENKENSIDLKLRNLDTEISSLEKEYESAKTIIKSSIEKSFKRYDA